MSIVVSASGNNQNQLREFAVLASHIFTLVLSFSYSFISNVTRWSFSPLFLAFPVISYLVAPFLVLATLIVKVSFLTPLSVAHHILHSLYPIYAFCSVACIAGILVGIAGRSLSVRLTRAFEKKELDETAPVVRGNERRNRRRRLRMREEDT
jgi:hypothetical protein